MATVTTLTEKKTVEVPSGLRLDLNKEEAYVLFRLLGRVAGVGRGRKITEGIWRVLETKFPLGNYTGELLRNSERNIEFRHDFEIPENVELRDEPRD